MSPLHTKDSLEEASPRALPSEGRPDGERKMGPLGIARTPVIDGLSQSIADNHAEAPICDS